MNDNNASDNTKEEAARALANLTSDEAILKKIVESDKLVSILKCLGGVLNDAEATDDAKQCATRAHEAILKKIVESKKLRSVFIRLFIGGYKRGAMRLIIHWCFSKNQPEVNLDDAISI